jgi:tetratricopeptide (TPR) repeat protein
MLKTMRALVCLWIAAACGRPEVKHPRMDHWAALLPATLEATQPRTGPATPLQIRVWADDAVRAEGQWQARFSDDLDHANQLLSPLLGVRLEIAEVKEWTPPAGLLAAARDLPERDPGEGVAWVIGIIAADAGASSRQAELGTSAPLGKHIVIRDYPQASEQTRLRARLPAEALATPGNLAEFYAAHRRHRQAVILLHHLARSLGAIADNDPSWLQHPLYSPRQSTVSERNREILTLSIAHRSLEKPDRAVLASELITSIEKSTWGGWVPQDHDEVIEVLRATVDAARSGQTAAEVPGAAFRQFEGVVRLVRAGSWAAAARDLEPLLAAYPANATIRLLGCELHLAQHGPSGALSAEPCARAIELAPGDPKPFVLIGLASLRTGDRDAGRGALAQAEERIANLAPARQGQAWLDLATMYRTLESPTLAERALGRAGAPDAALSAWIQSTRARYGLPADGGRFRIDASSESEYVAAVRSALAAVYDDQFARARTLLATADARWPGAPGLAAARCDLLFRQGKVAAARAHCLRAIEAYPSAAWAHYLLGIIELRGAGTSKGIAALERAIAADPTLAQAWRALAKALARAGNTRELEELNRRHRQQFGHDLAK